MHDRADEPPTFDGSAAMGGLSDRVWKYKFLGMPLPDIYIFLHTHDISFDAQPFWKRQLLGIIEISEP
jgi:hypothetical protein